MVFLSVIFGIGLGILWLVGLSTVGAALWLTWLDGIAAIAAFMLAAMLGRYAVQSRGVGGPVALGIALLGLWIIGMATNGAPWQNWWTFVFGVGFLVVALISGSRRPHMVVGPTEPKSEEEMRDRFKKSA